MRQENPPEKETIGIANSALLKFLWMHKCTYTIEPASKSGWNIISCSKIMENVFFFETKLKFTPANKCCQKLYGAQDNHNNNGKKLVINRGICEQFTTVAATTD